MKPSPEGNVNGRAVVGDVVEFATPIAIGSARVSFVVVVERVLNGTRHAVERLPNRGPIILDVPTAAFSAANWRA